MKENAKINGTHNQLEPKSQEKNSTATPDPKSGLVECVPKTDCQYETVEGPKTIKCECGYNQEGLSYCPKGTNISNLYI